MCGLGKPSQGASQSVLWATTPSASAAYGSHDAHHTGAARLPTNATIIINRSCGLSMTLLVPFHATRGTLPGILNGDIGCASQLLLGTGRCWADSLLAAYWVVTLCSSSVVFLKISVGS
jgi:hypothetical protein